MSGTSSEASGEAGRVIPIERCDLIVGNERWPFATSNAGAIDAHWAKQRAANPAMFNGVIHVLAEHRLSSGALSGRLLQTDFKSFLFWKDHGYPDRSVRDVFGSGLIRSVEGHVLLGRQAAGHLNAGLAYLPGGFIDQRDVDAEDRVDIAESVAREIVEETGLPSAALQRQPGMLVTQVGAMLSIAVVFSSSQCSRDLQAAMLAHIAADPEAELSDVVVVRTAADIVGLAMPSYASVLLARVFPRN